MDAYEATRVVFSRIQSLDPENAAKVMGFLLIQDNGEKEMIRLAFGPEVLLQSVVLKVRTELGLLPSSSGPSAAPHNAVPFPSLIARQGSSSRLLGGGGGGAGLLAASSPTSWAPPSVFSRASSNVGGVSDDLQSSDDLVSPSKPVPLPFNGGADLVDELQLQGQMPYLTDGAAASAKGLHIGQKRELLYQDMEGNCRSPSSNGENALFQYSLGWGATAGHHRRACSAADIYLASDAAGAGWKPCLYFARGYCKNGTSCPFLHGIPDDSIVTGCGKMDATFEQQCQELLLRSKSPRQLMASAFAYSPTGSVPASPSAYTKSMNFLLQQQNESQSTTRAVSAATAAALMLGGDECHKFIGRPWMSESSDFASSMGNPFSRQIYLTFPADSTFREEDVSSYFSIYGPVQDVRIPFQQKRMFGFVTFFYPETVRLILAKGNPHFVCNSRVLVKPYKEKGKTPKKQQLPQAEKVDFSGCMTPTPLDSRDPFDFPQLGSRTLCNTSLTQEVLLRRKLEEQQQAAELEKAIELQNRRFMGLQLLDLKNRSHFRPITNPSIAPIQSNGGSRIPQEESACQDKNLNPAAVAAEPLQKLSQQSVVNAADAASKGESCAIEPTSKEAFAFASQQSVDHILPDSPFASSPTRAAAPAEQEQHPVEPALPCDNGNNTPISSTLFPAATALDKPSFNGCFFQLPRFSPDHGAVGM